MPGIDYALLADFVRVEGGTAHLVAAGIDTVYSETVPVGQNLGLLARLTFTKEDGSKAHKVEILFRDPQNNPLVRLEAQVTVARPKDLPRGWPTGVFIGRNFGVPLPAYGIYSLVISVDGHELKSIPLRVAKPK